MESESKVSFWNLDAADFVPSGDFNPIPKPVANPNVKEKKENKKKINNKGKKKQPEERKFSQKPKETVVLSLIGPSQSGKSTLANFLSRNSSGIQGHHYSILQSDSKSRKYAIFDNTGATENQIVSISISDYIILVLPVISNSLEGYLKELSFLMKNYSTGRIVIILNHLDDINWDGTTYNNAVHDIRFILDKYGVNDTIFIPVASGINVNQRVTKDIAPWYNGKSLIQALDTLEIPQRSSGTGAKVPMLPAATNDPNCNFVGKLISGSLNMQSKVLLMPMSLKVDILSMFDIQGNTIENSNHGDVIKFSLRVPEELLNLKGLILCENKEKCIITKEFRAEVNLFNLGDTLVTSGFLCKMLLHCAEENIEVTEVISVTDLKNKDKIKINTARNEQKAIMVIRAANNVCAQHISKNSDCLGKFSLILMNTIIGVGKILELHNRVEEVASQMGF